MTRSIFDPTGGNAEHSGTGFTPPDADQISQMPVLFTNPTSSAPTGSVNFQPPAERPAVDISTEDDGRTLFIQLTGKLHADDYKHFVPCIDEAIQKHNAIRLLVRMHDFHGWDAGALWQDVKFDVTHFKYIYRLAFVGEKTWEKWMAAFCEPFTAATIRYFPLEQLAEARVWLAAP